MAKSVLRDNAKAFSGNIVSLCRKLKKNGVEWALCNQLLRAGTSVAANIHEAQYAQSKKDFASKLKIALKECNECDGWLQLLHDSGDISDADFQRFNRDRITICRMLVSSVRTVENKTKAQ